MAERGKYHIGALWVVAAELAFVVMRTGTLPEVRDTDGHLVATEEAKETVARRLSVTADIRVRRRSTKAGRAPSGHRGTIRETTIPSCYASGPSRPDEEIRMTSDVP